MAQSKHWCFTLNNYNDETLARLQSLSRNDSVSYLIFGKEVGDSGTPHLQGFIQLSQRARLTSVKALIGDNPHLEVARNVNASIAYCKKDNDFTEIGTYVLGSQGRRTDLDAFKEDVKGGMINLKDVREKHSLVYAKYPRFCYEFIQDNTPGVVIPMHALRDWQSRLYTELMGPICPRKVKFIVDLNGNAGKSWFAHYYVSLHENAQVLLPGRKADMSFCLRSDIRVLFIDAPRSKQGEFLQYDFFEEVKNGYVFSSKYESRLKVVTPCHIVVLMNEMPDLTKLSEDRFDIEEI